MKYPYIVGGFLWLGWIISIIFGEGNTDLTGTLIGTDFSSFYTAAKLLISGNSKYLYDIKMAYEIQQDIYAGHSPGLNFYLNPPHFAFFVSPFGLLPYKYSVFLWMALGLICLWLSIKVLCPLKTSRFFFLSLTWLPIFSAITFGQNSLFTLLLFTLSYYFWIRDRPILAGFVFSLLLYKPQFLFFIGVLWLFSARKNLLSIVSAGIGIFTQILYNFLFFPDASQKYIAYIKTVMPLHTNISFFPAWNSYSTYNFWKILLPDYPSLSVILYLVGIIVGILFFLKVWRHYSANRPIIFAVTLIWMIWSMPYINIYDWTILLLPALILWNQLKPFPYTLRTTFILLWIATFLSNSLAFLQIKLFGFGFQISIPIFFLTILCIYGILRTQILGNVNDDFPNSQSN